MSEIKVNYQAKPIKIAKLETDKKVTMKRYHDGSVKITSLMIGNRVAIRRVQVDKSIGSWEIPTEYLAHLCLKEQELIEAFDTANDSVDPAGD